MKRRVTIKDVAEKAGVSHPTVSRVIHDHPRISKKTKQHVQRVMAKLGYRPNLIARSLVKNRSRVIAFIIPDLNPHVQPLLRGVVDACRGNNYALMLFSTEYWTEADLSYAWVADNWRVDGMLIYNVIYHPTSRKERRRLEADRVPFVFINKHLRDKAVNTAAVDNADAVRQAVEHLAGLGRKRIGILNGNMKSVDGVERFEGFKKALAAVGLPYDEKRTGCANFADDQAYDEMKRLLYMSEPPDAMFCANDLMALGAMNAIREKGLSVPEDIAVVGFDDVEAARHFQPPLTTLRPPLREVGGRALDLLARIIDEPGRDPEQTPFSAKLVIRGSTVGASQGRPHS